MTRRLKDAHFKNVRKNNGNKIFKSERDLSVALKFFHIKKECTHGGHQVLFVFKISHNLIIYATFELTDYFYNCQYSLEIQHHCSPKAEMQRQVELMFE